MPSDARPLVGRADDSACVARAAGGGPGEGKTVAAALAARAGSAEKQGLRFNPRLFYP